MKDRFWSKVAVRGPNECWNWTGAASGVGYGAIRDGHTTLYAHRVSWELRNGPVPKGAWVLHGCNNRLCVNPSHLYLGDRIDNTRDATRRGFIGRIPSFHEGEIWLMKKLNRKGVPQHQVGDMFRCSQSHVSRLISGKRRGLDRKEVAVGLQKIH